jgi:hypothetical protein
MGQRMPVARFFSASWTAGTQSLELVHSPELLFATLEGGGLEHSQQT